ncbi:MAG: hypothetical protein HY308_16205 [Gammaproteobacteria bacterium]|nr:hypothetical protein [Gammaproteobacteria bacterium]
MATNLEIFWGSGSPHSWRVLLTAELKRIPYEMKRIETLPGYERTYPPHWRADNVARTTSTVNA